MSSVPYTYCAGPSLMTSERRITSKTVVGIVLLLGKLFDEEKYEFALEDATEAGIVWTKYPGQTKTSYKSFRFHFEAVEGGGWPPLTEERLERWLCPNDAAAKPEVLWTFKDNRTDKEREAPIGASSLKAMYGAPPWTVREVNLFRNAFRQFGIDSSPGPVAAKLRMVDP